VGGGGGGGGEGRGGLRGNMFRAFSHPVATCYNMLGVNGSNLKMVKLFMHHLWMLYDVELVWPGSCNNVVPGLRTSSICNSQHVTKRRNRVAKRTQHVAPNNITIQSNLP